MDPRTGDFVVRVGGASVPAPGAVPGDLVRLGPRDPRGAPGPRVEIVAPSPERVVPRCPHEGACGGCGWQHVRYDAQRRLKRERVQHVLEAALGGGVPEVAPVVAVPGGRPDGDAPWGFRAKVHFVFTADAAGRIALGHFRRGSRRVLPVSECPVHAPAGNDTARMVRDALARADVEPWLGDARRGVARHLVVRVAADTGERLATLVVDDAGDRRLRRVSRDVASGPAAPDGWHINEKRDAGPALFGPATRHVSGRARLRETVAGVSFLLSPTAFFQTNLAAAGALVEIVAAAVAPAGAREVLDLYAGAGLFALPLARRGCRVTAVEENPLAVADGEASRAFSQIEARACRFVRSRVEDYVTRLRRGGPAGAAEAVVLDPPREGCAPGLLARVLEHLQPAVLAYVSCEPLALARDLGALCEAGLLGSGGTPYRLAAVQPVDMFPHTPHVETVAVLRRR